MTTKSLPSKKTVVVSAPEVNNFGAKFNYDFFVADERTNSSGDTAPRFIVRKPAESFDESFVSSKNFHDKVPRFVKFNWSPIITPRDYIAVRTSIGDNFDKIHNEQNFSLEETSNIDFQDTGADQRLNFFIRRALEEVQKGFAPTEPESPLDVAKALNELTTSTLRGGFLASILTNLGTLGVTFVTKENKENIIASLAQKIQGTKTKFQFNTRVLSKILASITENPVGLFEDEAKILMTEAEQRESRAVASSTADIMRESDYDMEIMEYVGVRAIDTPANFDSTVQAIGYIIDKKELLEDGTLVDRSPIIVESPLANTTVDLQIKYGGIYYYRIRSVIFVEVQAQDIDSGGVVAISFLVCSQDSTQQVVECTEYVPPPPPADFNIAWDYKNLAARITWAFPNNPQRDIKYFQLFRRKTINEPFELIKEYDFDDSIVKTPRNETPDSALTEVLSNPINYYLDKEFGRDSKYIYSMCTVDAHGMSSNYSTQFEISFDRFKNRISKKLISVFGAPKAYPNMFLNEDTFVDTFRDSGHGRMRVIFNPEYITTHDVNGNDLGFLKMGEDSEYKISIINVDLQSQKTITINLKDKRSH